MSNHLFNLAQVTQRSNQVTTNRLLNEQRQNNLDQQPRRNELLDLQIQSQQAGNDRVPQQNALLDAQVRGAQISNTAGQQELNIVDDQQEQGRLAALAERDATTLSTIGQLPPEQRQAAYQQLSQQLGPDVQQQMGGQWNDVNASNLINQAMEFADVVKQGQGQKPTTAQQNAQFAFPNNEAAQRSAVGKKFDKTPLVSIGAENKERGKIAEIQAMRFSKIVDKAENARDALDNINQLEAIDVKTGALEPMKASFAAVIESLGFDASGIANVANAQSFQGVTNRMVNDVLNRAKGPQTDGDAKRAKDTIASLGNSPQAKVFLNASLKALAFRQIEQSEYIEQRIDQGMTFSKANKEWNQYKRKTPSLSSVVKTANGLPMFYYQFKDRAQQLRPEITDEQIINAWREKHGK